MLRAIILPSGFVAAVNYALSFGNVQLYKSWFHRAWNRVVTVFVDRTCGYQPIISTNDYHNVETYLAASQLWRSPPSQYCITIHRAPPYWKLCLYDTMLICFSWDRRDAWERVKIRWL